MASRVRGRGLFTLRNAVRVSLVGAAATGAGLYAVHRYINTPQAGASKQQREAMHHPAAEIHNRDIPSRAQMIERLRRSATKPLADSPTDGQDEVYDVLVIGGGATGTGVALDAISRGLKVALVERDDFASGTSSRSTKLIHGGVRYLEKAFTNLDMGQLHLVQDALRERRHLINIAPHLSRPLPIIVPLYQSWPSVMFYAPYFYAGVKAYDFFAGDDGVLEPSYWISYHEAREKFPMLKAQGLKGGVVYYDGQHNDSRMCLGIALTAAAKGAVIANHVEVTSISTDAGADRVTGATVKDNLSGETFSIRSKMVVNATGPFCDAVRSMATDGKAQNMIAPSSGVHVVLSDQYSPEGMGLIIPETSDGRVIFLLPWEGSTVVGTTDAVAPISALPRPYEHEIQFILKEVSQFLNHEVKREDVDAAWAGIRPLAKDVNAKDTASTSRDHVVEVTRPGMVTIAGGKWTTYRKMAEDAVDAVLRENKALAVKAKANPALNKFVIDTTNVGESQTLGVPLIGAAGWSLQLPTTLHRLGFDKDIAQHLSHNYGDKSFEISKLIQREKSLTKRLAGGYPFIEAEVVYAARHEHALTATDMIANRIRLAFLNSDASYHALPRVINLMARELGWDTSRKIVEYRHASKFLSTMNRKGKNPLAYSDPLKMQETENRLRQVFDYVPINDNDIASLRSEFNAKDVDEDGHLSRSDVMALVASTAIPGLQDVKADLQSQGGEAVSKSTAKFLQQLDLLDKDDSISWEPFLFSVAASFHSLAPRATLSNAPDQSDLHSLDKFKSVVAVEARSQETTSTTTPVAAIAADNVNDKNEQ